MINWCLVTNSLFSKKEMITLRELYVRSMIHVQLNEISKMVLSKKMKTLSSVQIPVALHEILLGAEWDSQFMDDDDDDDADDDDDDDPHLGSVTPRYNHQPSFVNHVIICLIMDPPKTGG